MEFIFTKLWKSTETPFMFLEFCFKGSGLSCNLLKVVLSDSVPGFWVFIFRHLFLSHSLPPYFQAFVPDHIQRLFCLQRQLTKTNESFKHRNAPKLKGPVQKHKWMFGSWETKFTQVDVKFCTMLIKTKMLYFLQQCRVNAEC